MLNELHHLANSLEKAGIKLHDWDPHFKQLPKITSKAPCYRIVLGKDGVISNVSKITPELGSILRKWEHDNGSSFPGMNLCPLFRITDESKKEALRKWQKDQIFDAGLLLSWCIDETRNWTQKLIKKQLKCLSTVPAKLSAICGKPPKEFASLHCLFERINQLQADIPGKCTLFDGLWTFIQGKLKTGERVEELVPLLLHLGDPTKKADKDSGAVSVFFDVTGENGIPVAHEKTMAWINEQLARDAKPPSGKSAGIDAYGSEDNAGDEKFPPVRLPLLGDVKLRSMFKDSACQTRYGTIESRSFPVGFENRKRTKAALEWLSEPSRENATWGKADGEILFAYPSIIPSANPQLISVFGPSSAEDQDARFEEYARQAISALQAIQADLSDVQLQIFSLRKMDKARTKVVFYRNYSAKRLQIAATEWTDGCQNIPEIALWAWGEKKGEAILQSPRSLFPLEVARCINQVWKMDGTSKCTTAELAPTTGLELLLASPMPTGLVAHLLCLTLQNTRNLLLSEGQLQHLGKRTDLKGINKHKLLVPALLGLLLSKMSIRKGTYMNEPAYLIGQMLNLADGLHALYCEEVRKGAMPPQLLGNALMPSALNSPSQALSLLAQRIGPYLGWARTNKSKKVGLSRYFLKAYGNIEEKFAGSVPERLDDAQRAQLLLGYLAKIPTSKENDNTTETNGESNE